MSLITPRKQKLINKLLICNFSFLKMPFAIRKYLYQPIRQGGQVCALSSYQKATAALNVPTNSKYSFG